MLPQCLALWSPSRAMLPPCLALWSPSGVEPNQAGLLDNNSAYDNNSIKCDLIIIVIVVIEVCS